MKKLRVCSLVLLVAMVLQCAGISAFAATLAEQSSFAFEVKQAADGSPGNILVEMYCQSDPQAAITTVGATIVINTEYIDVVNKKGEATTDTYKTDMSTLGKSSTVAAAASGSEDAPFSGFRGLSIASYNADSKEMYVFLCGMATDTASGVSLGENTKIATIYFNAKTGGKLPAGAIRLMKESEIGKECPSKAVFVSEISSKTEIANEASPITLSVDEALMEQAETPTKADETTQKESDKDVTKATTPAAATTKAVADMSEAEVESELRQRVAAGKAASFTQEQKQSDAYKAYEKALAAAEEILADENATAAQKQEALENLRKAQEALEQEFPELTKQLEVSAKTGDSKWLIIGICAAAVALGAVVAVIVIKKKKKKSL